MLKRFLTLIAVLVLVGLLWTWRQCRQAYRGFPGNLILVIEPGTRAPEVAQLLVARGVLKQRWPFLLRYWLGRRRHYLKAGEYLFDRPLGPRDVYWKLVQGDVYLHAVVIPEGSDRFDIARILHHQMGISPAEFLRTTRGDIRSPGPGAAGAHARRLLVPRYLSISAQRQRLYRGRDDAGPLPPGLRGEIPAGYSIAARPAWRYDTRLAGRERNSCSRRASACRRGVSPTAGEALGAAVRPDGHLCHSPQIPADGAPITAAYLERSQSRVALQYLSESRLAPGPVANPGEASIEAAMHPAPGDALYFVSNNQGGHFFANSLRDHNRNVAHYRNQRTWLQDQLPIVVKPTASPASRHRAKAGTSPRHSAERAKREH